MPEPPTVFNLSGVNRGTVMPASTPADPKVLQIPAGPGTVPAGAVVRITNLDDMSAVAASGASPDGSFEVDLLVTDGQELRFEWVNGAERSAPADAIISRPEATGQAFTFAESPRFNCLKLSPGFVLDFVGSATVTLGVENGCTQAVALENPRGRLGLPDFTLPATLPASIAAGESAELQVDFTRNAAGLREDVLLVDVTLGASTIRYPITLRAE